MSENESQSQERAAAQTNQQNEPQPAPQPNETFPVDLRESFARLETLQPTDVIKSLAGLENVVAQPSVGYGRFNDVEPERDTGASFAGLENLMPLTNSFTAPSSGDSQNQNTTQNTQGNSGSSTQSADNGNTSNQQSD